MRKIYTIIALSVLVSTIFAQSVRRGDLPLNKMKVNTDVEKTSNPLNSIVLNNSKATWDVLFTFNAIAAANPGIETDGTNFYTTAWNSGNFTRYDMDGANPVTFTVAGATNIRDMAYDGTYFYGSSASMTLYIMDLANEVLIGSVTATCAGVTGIRHIAYDPTLDGGNGGFWIGNWNELGAIAMNGAQLIASTATLESCYGSAYDPFSDPANPCLWLFQQPTGAEAVFYQFDITTYSMTGVTHDCSDAPGFIAGSISGGACSYEDNGLFILVGSIQQDPNLVVAYELATTSEPTAPNVVNNLVVTPGADGALTYSISWDNPTIDVNGDPLAEITEIYFYLDGVLVTGLTYDYTVGNNNAFIDLTVPTPGSYTFRVVCENTAGLGINTTVTEWIGYFPPENIVFSNLEDISVEVAWTQEGTPDSWDMELLAAGGTPTETPTHNTALNPYTIGSLTAGTSYDLYMRAVFSGGNSIWVGPFTFTTPNCASVDACEYEFLLVDSYGDGWNGASIDVVEDGSIIANLTIATGTDATIYVPVCNGTTIELIWNAGSWDEEVSFTVNNPFSVQVYTVADVTAFVDGAVFTTFTSSCTPPTCPAPTDLNVSNITTTSADLEWTEAGTATAWNVEIGAAGFTPTGTGVAAATNPYNASGLNPGVAYDFYVQADCGAGDLSIWTGPFTFNTGCDIISSYPFTEGFETAVPPTCWLNVDADGDTYGWSQVAAPDFSAHSGGFSAMSASWISGPGALTPDNYLISPQFLINDAALELSCWLAPQDPAYPQEKYSIMISTTGNATTDFAEIHTGILEEADTIWTEVVLPLAAYNGESVYFAVRHWDVTDMFQIKLDDFKIDFYNSVDNKTINTISVYPNPSNGLIKVSNANTIVVYNMIGEVVASVNDASGITTVDLSNLTDGSYIVKANNGTEIITKKINIIK